MNNNNTTRFLRNLTIFLAVLLSILIPGLAHAAGNAVIRISIPDGAVDPGEQFTISIDAQPNNAIAGMQFNLSYNPDIVTVSSVTEGNLLDQGSAGTFFNAGQINNTAGTVTGVFGAIISPGETVATAGTFAIITMTAGSAGGSCPLTLSNIVVGDIGGNSIPVSAINNSITIEGTTPDPPPGGGGSVGGGGASGGATTSLRNSMTTDGVMTQDVWATDIDMKVELRLYQDTIVKNKYGQALPSISIAPAAESQPAGEFSAMISQSYQIEPSGATFEESATLVFKYSTDDIPADLPTSNLYIALWDPIAMTWTDLGGTIDDEALTVSVEINHLSVYALMAHSRPASLKVMSFDLTPHEIAPGGTVTASMVVNNQGDLSGIYEVNLKLDNVLISTKSVTVNGGDSETIVFTLTSDTVGEHSVSLGNAIASFIVKIPLSPAAFTASELTINPDSVNSGENVNISVLFKNTGDLAGIDQITLFLDDIAVETREISLDVNESAMISFSLTPGTTGQHEVIIGGLQGFFEVKTPATPPIVEIPKLWLSNLSITPVYNETTNTLVNVRIIYQTNQAYENPQDANIILMVFRNGGLIEQVPLFTLSQLQEDGKTGEFSYIPSAGWVAGEYSFQVDLFDGEDTLQGTLSQNLTITSEELIKVFNWWTLGAVIGIAMIMIVVLITVIIFRRRDMLRS
jgi:hypothetical protein